MKTIQMDESRTLYIVDNLLNKKIERKFFASDELLKRQYEEVKLTKLVMKRAETIILLSCFKMTSFSYYSSSSFSMVDSSEISLKDKNENSFLLYLSWNELHAVDILKIFFVEMLNKILMPKKNLNLKTQNFYKNL